MTKPVENSESMHDPVGSIFLPGSRAEELAKQLVKVCDELGSAIVFDRSGVPKIDRQISDEEADAEAQRRILLHEAIVRCRQLGRLAIPASV